MWSSHLFRTFYRKVYRPNCQVFQGFSALLENSAPRTVIEFQRWILQKCGVKIKNCYVVYHGEDESNPFVIEEVTEQAKSYSYEVDDNIWSLDRVKKQSEEPEVDMGEQCDFPYECWYKGYCDRCKNHR